jgi:hypothetical protein
MGTNRSARITFRLAGGNKQHQTLDHNRPNMAAQQLPVSEDMTRTVWAIGNLDPA